MNRFVNSGDSLLLEPKIGHDFRANKAFHEVLRLFDYLNYPQALFEIDQKLKYLNGNERLDWLRLKAEFLTTHDQIWAALAVFKEILSIMPNDTQATFLSAFYAHRNGLKADFEYYSQTLKSLSDHWFNKLMTTLKFISTYNGDTTIESLITKSDQFDCLVLCGMTVGEDGQPSPILESRLEKFYQMAKAHPRAKLVVSGGAVNSPINEGWAMHDWLLKKDINHRRIVVDPYARDTVGNIFGFEKVIIENNFRNICIITSLSHLPRAWMSLVLNLSEQNYEAVVKGAAPEPPGSIICPNNELSLTYTTVIRSAKLFLPADFRAKYNVNPVKD